MAFGARALRVSFGDWPPRLTVAELRKKAAKEVVARQAKGEKVAPVVIEGRKIAATFWGKAWCDNLERYSDFASRLPRGRSYVRHGSVIDLKITAGKVTALVQGSELYSVTIDVKAVEPALWQAIASECAGKIDSVVELLAGKLSGAVMEVITRQGSGLFPAPAQIGMRCSCPDWATMCKHLAATLYGIGARLDHQPELLFELRGQSPAELVTQAAAGGILRGKARANDKVLGGADLASMFGIELDDEEPPAAVAPAEVAPEEVAPVEMAAKGVGAAAKKPKAPRSVRVR